MSAARFRSFIATLLAAALFAGCSGSDGARSGDSPSTVPPIASDDTGPAADGGLVDDSGVVDEALVAETRAAIEALDLHEQEREAAALDVAIERQLWTLVGFDDELGGTEAADEVFAGLFVDFDAQARSVAETPIVVAGLRTPAQSPADEGYGAAMFGSMLFQALLGKAMVQASNDGSTGSLSQDGLSATVTAAGIEATLTQSTEYKGATIGMVTTVKLDPCPDPNGLVEVISSTETTSSAGGASLGAKVEVRSLIQVDDNAGVADSKYSFKIDRQATTPSGAAHRMTLEFGLDSSVSLSFASWFESVEYYNETVKLGQYLAILADISNVKAARAGWESGRCVDLQTAVSDGPTGLETNAEVTINARPRAKSDGSPTGGTVTALLSGGEASVDPSSTPLPADAEFSYTASSERDVSGTVSLEARSKRGIGRATVGLDTNAAQAFSAVGGEGDWQASGNICNLDEPFELTGGGLTASGAGDGTYTFSGNFVYDWSGGGTYSVVLADDAQSGTMTLTGTNIVHSEHGDFSRPANASFALTALENC